MKKLENKVAVITGGNSGIGLATAKLFAGQGAKIAVTGRNIESIGKAIKEIGHGAFGLAADVSDLKGLDKSYQAISDKFGKIDVLVVNAGIFIAVPFAETTEEQFDQQNDINFKGVFFSVQKALPYLNDGASIVLTSSTVSDQGLAGIAAYSATKAAVRSLARTFSTELLDRRIRVNVLSPGPVDTPIFGRNGGTDEEISSTKQHFATMIPAKRLGTPEEMAAGFLYLASDDSKYMIGGELLLDGGARTL